MTHAATADNRQVLYRANPAMFRNHPIIFIICLILIPAFGIGIVFLLVWFLSCRARVLVIDNVEVLYEQGLLSKDRMELKLTKIRSTRIRQSLSQRIFGTGNVEIYTAGDMPEIVAPGMPNPQKIRSILKT